MGRDAQYVYLLARHFPDRLNGISADSIHTLVEPIMQNRFNTLSSAYTILALGQYTRARLRETGKTLLSIYAGDENSEQLLAQAAVYARANVATGTNRLSIHGSNDEEFYYVLAQSGYDDALPTAIRSDGLEIERVYLNEQNEAVKSAQVGAELTVRLRVRSTGRTRHNVAIIDLLPGGFEVMLDSVHSQGGRWQSDYLDVREDRVVIYGSLDDRVSEIVYRVKLTNPGKFVVPAAYAGSMYDHSIQANSLPDRFIVWPAK